MFIFSPQQSLLKKEHLKIGYDLRKNRKLILNKIVEPTKFANLDRFTIAKAFYIAMKRPNLQTI